MIVERLHNERLQKDTDRELQKQALARPDNKSAGAEQPDELKQPLEFVSSRLRKKIRARRTINESRNRQDRASRDTPIS